MEKKRLLDAKLDLVRLNSKFEKIKEEKNKFMIQSVVFPTDKFTKEKAIEWAKAKGYKTDQVFESGNFINLRQEAPGSFNVYKTVKLDDDVQAKVAGNVDSRFSGHLELKEISKFSAIKSEMDLQIPMEVEMWALCEGTNRDGLLPSAELEKSKDLWSSIPIIDWHDLNNISKPTQHRISDRKGYMLNSPKIKFKDGKNWLVNKAHITDRYFAYLIYLSEMKNKPLQISAEFSSSPKWVNGLKHQTNITPHLITIVDKGHIIGNQLIIKNLEEN